MMSTLFNDLNTYSNKTILNYDEKKLQQTNIYKILEKLFRCNLKNYTDFAALNPELNSVKFNNKYEEPLIMTLINYGLFYIIMEKVEKDFS